MYCALEKYKKQIPTHFIGNTGKEYVIDDYANWGTGKLERGKNDLPKDEYPYKMKYEIVHSFACCRNCNCSKV